MKNPIQIAGLKPTVNAPGGEGVWDAEALRYVSGEMSASEVSAFEARFSDVEVCESVARQTELLLILAEACTVGESGEKPVVFRGPTILGRESVRGRLWTSRVALVVSACLLWLLANLGHDNRFESLETVQRALLANSWMASMGIDPVKMSVEKTEFASPDPVDREDDPGAGFFDEREGMLLAALDVEEEAEAGEDEIDLLEVPDWLCVAMLGQGDFPEQ